MNTVIRTVSPLLVVSGAALESAVLLGHPPISAGGRDLMIGVGVSLVVVGLIARIANSSYTFKKNTIPPRLISRIDNAAKIF